MQNTSSAGSAEQNGSQRLNPRQIAVKLIAVKDGSPVRVLDASDEQFEAFIREVGIRVKQGDEGEKWSFDNRCRVINFALQRGLHLPFVDPNNSTPEQKTIPEKRPEVALEQDMIDIPNAPIISGWANIVKGVMTGQVTTNERGE